MEKQSVAIAVGEPSGDKAAARVVERMSADSGVRWFGIGGDHMARAGVELIAHIDGLTAMGLGDVAGRLGRWLRAWAVFRERVRRERPPVALLVDNPEVNVPLARALSAEGVKVVQYVGPQVWAWRRGRLGLLARRVHVTALVLPFEKALYDRAGVPCQYVGHPIMDEPAPLGRAPVRERLSIGLDRSLVALLPGSRTSELSRHVPVMVDAGQRLCRRGVEVVLAPGKALAPNWAAQIRVLPPDLTARDLLGAADGAIVTSGTATLEATVAGTPMAVVYRLGGFSWAVAQHLVRIPYVALPNWIAGRVAVPELLQDQVTPAALEEQAMALLDPAEQKRQGIELARVARLLGGSGAAERVARLVMERLE